MNELEIPSPCRQVCQLGTGDICLGCGRSLNEIAEWSAASSMRKLQICKQARIRIQLNNERHQDQ
jgi:predicted Fe-S protein YdhL (DUF1289 family)